MGNYLPQSITRSSSYATSPSPTSNLSLHPSLTERGVQWWGTFQLVDCRRNVYTTLNNCVLRHNPFDWGGVMVCAAISHRFKSKLVVAKLISQADVTHRQRHGVWGAMWPSGLHFEHAILWMLVKRELIRTPSADIFCFLEQETLSSLISLVGPGNEYEVIQ